MSWFILFVAGLLEIGWAIGLKYSDGLTRFWPSVATLLALIVSFVLLGVALKHLPVGTAYAIWVGIGALGTALLGVFLFSEAVSPLKLISLGLICIGIVGLKLAHS
ncbi:quaternary ammonium compound efflux SMR transporter SugE [Marinospirillum sp. MEB164]|uniref:Guanidinium exporter n=1 Tax=Marinospirillum alkalitolerans TaxID=3123374 RepID=A0ABW8PYX7_9GAMM